MMRPQALLFSLSSIYVRYHRRILATIGLSLVLELFYNIYSLHITHPTRPLDEPFSIGCQEPDTSAPRENATIIMLAQNSAVDGAVKSLTSLEEQFNKWFHYPVVFLNDQAWDQGFIDAVTEVASGHVHFGLIGKGMWEYPEWIDQGKARRSMDTQAQAGVLYAGNESYHHMCRFNSG
jgi:mannosyltransferase